MRGCRVCGVHGCVDCPEIKVVCAWCKVVIREGPATIDGLVSHGCCLRCKQDILEREGLTS